MNLSAMVKRRAKAIARIADAIGVDVNAVHKARHDSAHNELYALEAIADRLDKAMAVEATIAPVELDKEKLHAKLTEISGIGPAKANAIVEVVAEALSDAI